MRAWFTAIALVFCALSTRAALGDTPRVLVATLEVQKGPNTERCVDEPALAKAVEARLGRRVFGVRTPPDLQVKLRLDRPRPNEWRGELSLLDASGNELGRREVLTKAKDCSALDASLALVVALLVDAPPNLPPAPAPAPAPAAPPVAPVPRPVSTPLQIPRDTFAPREPWRIHLTAGGAALLGFAPRPLFGAAVGLGFRAPHLPSFRIDGEFVPPTRVELGTERGAELTLVRVGLALCPLEHDGSSLRLELCAGQQVGWVGVEGYGFDENRKSGELAYALEAAGGAFWRLVPGFGLWLSAALEVPLVRNTYVSGIGTDGTVELFQSASVAGNAQIGVGIEF